jgi:hypothetical protein
MTDATLYADDVTVADGLDPHFPFAAYLDWLRAGNPYGLAGLKAWADRQYAGVELHYEALDGSTIASMIWVNVPSRVNRGLETMRGPRWAMDVYGGAQRAHLPRQRLAREAATTR